MNTIAQVKRNPLQLVLVSACALIAAAVGGNAAAADGNASATTTVISALTITKAEDLSFGNVIAGSTAGTIKVDTNGVRTVGGGVVLGSGTGTAAKFDITGSGTMTYTITYASGVQLTGPGTAMSLTQISDATGAGGASGLVTSGTLVAGLQSLFIGGTLDVGANQTGGLYTGSLTATVNYN
ncbi:MAG TPA: DUF4402 domain-containing protein [Telluria sp.]